MDAVRIGDVHHAGDRAATRAEHPVNRVRKRPEEGLVKRSVKRPSKPSNAMTGRSSGPGGVPIGDAEDIVSKSAPPWSGRGTAVPRGRLPLRYFVLTWTKLDSGAALGAPFSGPR